MVQLSHLYMSTGKTIALTIQIFTGKGMSLLFNMLSRFVIVFLPGSKHLLISWLQMVTAAMKLQNASWKEGYDKLSVLKSRDMTLLTNVCTVKAKLSF